MLPAILPSLPVIAAGAGAVLLFGKDLISGKNGKTIALVGGGIFVYYILKQQQAEAAKKEYLDKFGTDANVQAAVSLYNAMHKYGNFLDSILPSADKSAIIAIANTISDWKKVQEAYNTIYKSDLINDLQKSLGTEQWAQLNTIIDRGNKGISPANVQQKPSNVRTKLEEGLKYVPGVLPVQIAFYGLNYLFPRTGFEQEKKNWQNKWTTSVGFKGKVYNRFLGKQTIYFEEKQSNGKVLVKNRVVDIPEYILLGTTDGSLAKWDKTNAYIKVDVAADNLAKYLGINKVFYINNKGLMNVLPPVKYV